MCLPPPSFREAGAAAGETRRPSPAPTEATVKRVDLYGNVVDTHQTEAELNGFRPSQGRML